MRNILILTVTVVLAVPASAFSPQEAREQFPGYSFAIYPLQSDSSGEPMDWDCGCDEEGAEALDLTPKKEERLVEHYWLLDRATRFSQEPLSMSEQQAPAVAVLGN